MRLLQAPAPTEDMQYARFIDTVGSGLQQRIARQLDEAFFFGPSHRHELCARLRKATPGGVRDTIAAADRMAHEGIELLGRRLRIMPGAIDWHADPVSQRRMWPLGAIDEAWAIAVAGADVKYVWEVNRHQFLTTLGRAYWFTDDPRYLQQAAGLIDDWLAHNPPGCGVNWSSHLEVAVRAVSWLWTMPYLLAWPDLDPAFLKRWLLGLADHHRHLRANLSVFTDPTNHLIGEATALWMLSVCLPDLPDASRQAARAQAILIPEFARQTTGDGVNREQSSSYHRFVLDFHLQFFLLARRNARALPDVVEERLRAMFSFAAALAGPRGVAPMIGDSDDARAIPFLELVGWDFRDLLCTGSHLFPCSIRSPTVNDVPQAVLWLLRGEVSNPPSPSAPIEHSHVFTAGGYAFLRSRACGANLELIFDCGPLGLLPNAAHGHADALSVLIRLNGRELLGDPGTGTYFANRRVRDALRSTAAHNTVTVDHLNQADILDTFKWINPMTVRLCEHFVGQHFDYIQARHDGYQRLRNPLLHERRVLFVKPRGWVIVYVITGRGAHIYTRHFNFPPGIRLSGTDAGTMLATDPESGHSIALDFAELDPHGRSKVRLDEGALWSNRYGRWASAVRLSVDIHDAAPVVLFTFVTPVLSQARAAQRPTHSVERLAGGGVACTSYDAQGCTQVIAVNPDSVPVTLSDGTRSDAHFLFLRKAGTGAMESVFLAGEGCSMVSGGLHLRPGPGARFASLSRDAPP
jgi:uncharacterized heparinase superfamily protein